MSDNHEAGYECRDIRHSWEHEGDNNLIEQKGQVKHFARTLVCRRCETRRVDEYKISDYAIAKVRTRYTYPDYYRVPGGISLDDVRLALFKDMVLVSTEATVVDEEPKKKRRLLSMAG